jgi:hypothetical protein
LISRDFLHFPGIDAPLSSKQFLYHDYFLIPTRIMTEYLKPIIIAQFVLAILVLPSSAFVVCNGSGEDLDGGTFSSLCEAQTCWEYCKSPGTDDVYDLGGYDYGTARENESASCCYPPVAYDRKVTMFNDTPVEITLNATDPDGDPMTYCIVAGPLYGALGTVAGNMVAYTADANYTGVDLFSFRANDGTWDSNNATVTITIEPNCSRSHAFYGNVTIGSEPAPEYTNISVAGPGVRPNITGNPVATLADGSYGSANVTAQQLLVQGCIEDGAPLAFSVDGVLAEVCDVKASGQWLSAYPFRAGEVTNLDIRVQPPDPPPDTVYINAIGVTISNDTYGYSQTIKVEKNPWVELRVSSGVFTIEISATGYHDFRDYPLLGRNATLGIYENGSPVSSNVNVAFGSRTVGYQYVPTETRTFDMLIFVNERPEIQDVKHLTIYVYSGSDITATVSPGGSISPAGQVLADALGAQLMALSRMDFRSLM